MYVKWNSEYVTLIEIQSVKMYTLNSYILNILITSYIMKLKRGNINDN